jgi:hypothetical protein
MPSYTDDTPQQIEEIQINIMRGMPVERKIQLVFALSQGVRELARTGIKLRHPQADNEEVNHRLAILMLGEELAEKTLGRRSKGN